MAFLYFHRYSLQHVPLNTAFPLGEKHPSEQTVLYVERTTLLGVWEIQYDKDLCVICEAHVRNVSLWSRGRAHSGTDKMESQQGNTPHPGSLPAGVTPDHLWACLSQRAEVVMWICACVCVWICVCVFNIVFHSDCKAWETSVPFEKWQFEMRTEIVSLVRADPVNYSSAHNGKWTLVWIVKSSRNSNWLGMQNIYWPP